MRSFTLLVLVLVVSVVLMLWFRTTPGEVRPESPAVRTGGSGDLGGEPAAVKLPAHGQGEPERRAAEALAEEPPPQSSEAPTEAERFTFLGNLVGPGGEALVVQKVSVRLVQIEGPEGAPATIAPTARVWEETGELRLEELPGGVYELTVQAEGCSHQLQRVEMKHSPNRGLRLAAGTPQSRVVREDVVVWPRGWIAIVVETPEGLPFSSITDALGLEPRRYFAGAFVAAAGTAPIHAGSSPQELHDAGAARFHEPHGYQSVRVAGSAVGSLEVFVDAPLWVGLWVYGRLLDAQLVPPSATEAVFVLGESDLEERFASVSLRVLDEGGLPHRDAECTLKADSSAYRRADLSSLALDEAGRVEFLRVVPGQHELTVQNAGALHQERIQLAPGERRDLGDLVLRSTDPISVTAVNEKGERIDASIRVAPLEAGRTAFELYPPNRHRSTTKSRAYELPVPGRLSIVQGEVSGRSRISRNVRIDPSDPPETLELVLLDEFELSFDPQAPWENEHKLQLVDEHGIVVEEFAHEHLPDRSWGIVPGPYQVVRLGADDEPLGSVPIDVRERGQVFQVP